jgi:hypothetical protein
VAMDRCRSHPPRFKCQNCGAPEGEYVLDPVEILFTRKDMDVAWREFSQEEKDIYQESLEAYKAHQKMDGHGATLAYNDVVEFRYHLRALVSRGGVIYHRPGKLLLERIAEIVYARDKEQLKEYYQGPTT